MKDLDAERDEPERVWMRIRARFGDPAITTKDGRRRTRRAAASEPFTAGRDPLGLGGVLDGLVSDAGWQGEMAQGGVLAEWPRIVGPEIADKTAPEGIAEGLLVVRCVSTAWEQQMRLMRADITTRIIAEFPQAGIVGIRFVGPQQHSFLKGPRTVRGRGPRDTWG
ncbi:DUF721 domain-containing protein [Agrococcus jejuensis]|uniref:Predicted nucleic acid-binding protein, contains Zn-ribbon domain (Includes truncated derivatives) n=1 Tax=Agrococcus jejuensis TaxID=399736 RepID=A0A1G8DEX4_9MICO|nr:DciA family protein [Agrococcus jejuensis]SDH55840.1 Predicted nucleic acid-binding protein, contains Zn-ribbon domain (includes truncated derivatives) [Agrococcus jejuensis]